MYGQEGRFSKKEGKMAMNEETKYDCTICPYPGYRDKKLIFCDICICRILEEQEAKKRRKTDVHGK